MQSNIERKEESERQLEMRGGEWERMGEEREEEESEREGERERKGKRSLDFAPADSFPGASNIGVNPNTEVIIYYLLGS